MSLDSRVVGRHHRQKKKILIAIAIIFLLTPAVLQQEEPALLGNLSSLFSLFPRSDATSSPIATLLGTDVLENSTFVSGSSNGTSDAITPYAVAFDPVNNELYVTDFENEADQGGATIGSLYVSVLQEPTDQLIGSINVTLPASLSVARPYSPESVTVDPTNGLVYVAYSNASYVTAINGSTNRIVKYISTGDTGYGFVSYDSKNGNLYEYASNGFLSIIDTATNSLVQTINVEQYQFETSPLPEGPIDNAVPFPITTSSTSGNVYLLGYNSTIGNYRVSVVNGTTNQVVKDFSPTGWPLPSSNPTYEELGIAVNPSSGNIYVSGSYPYIESTAENGLLLVINGTTNSTIANVPVPTSPDAVLVNPTGTELYLSLLGCEFGTTATNCRPILETYNATNNALGQSIIYPTNGSGGAFSGAGYPGMRGLALDPINGGLYMAAPGLEEVVEANTTTNLVTGETAIQMAPFSATFDAYNGYVYVVDDFSDSLSVINGSTNLPVTTVLLGYNFATEINFDPKAITVDPFNGNVYVAAEQTNSFVLGHANCTVVVVSGQTEKIIANVTLGTVTDNTFNTCTSDGIAFDTVNKDVYVANPAFNSIAVINSTTNQVITNVNSTNNSNPQFYEVNQIAADPDNGYVYVTNSGYTFDQATGENSAYVSLIDGATNTLTGNVSLENEVDTITGCTSCNATSFGVVFDQSLNEMLVSSVAEPNTIAYGLGNNGLNNGPNKTITAINATTNTFIASHLICLAACDVGLGIAVNPANGLIYSDQLNIVNSLHTAALTAANPTTFSFAGQVNFAFAGFDTQGITGTGGNGPSDVGRIAIDPSNGEIFAPVIDSDTVSIFASSSAPPTSEFAALVRDPSGNPLSGITVSFFNQLNDPIGIGLTNSSGLTSPIQGLSAGTVVYAEPYITSSQPYLLPSGEVSFTLIPGNNIGDLQLEPIQTGSISGSVTFLNGTVAGGALVTADVSVAGKGYFTYSATANSSGDYIISNVNVGTGSISASLPNSTASFRSELESLAVSTLGASANLTLSPLIPGTLSMVVYTQYVGGEPQPLLVSGYGSLSYYGYEFTDAFGNAPLDDPYIQGYPGEQLKVCFNLNHRLNLPVGCSTTTVQSNGNATATIYLVQTGAVVGNITDAVTGQLVPNWNGYLYSVNSSGYKTLVETLPIQDCRDIACTITGSPNSTLSVGVGLPGQYELLLFGSDSTNVPLFGSLNFDLLNGTLLQAGNISLYPESLFTGGYNELIASPVVSTPGGTLNLRVTFQNPPTSFSIADDAKLLLDIPAGTSLVPGSISLNGSSVTNAVSIGSEYALPLGDLAPGSSGEVLFSIQISSSFNATRLDPIALMNYTLSGVAHQDVVGSSIVSVPGLNLNALLETSTLSTAIAGQAPPQSTVTVFDNNTLLGLALSGSGGYWQMNVTLPNVGNQSVNNLEAQAKTATGLLLNSTSFMMIYANFFPTLVNVCMQQVRGGSNVCFNPSGGEALSTTPFHIEGNGPIDFELQFSDPSAVTNVTITIVNLGTTNATLSSNGLYTASIEPGVMQNVSTVIPPFYPALGPIFFNYSPSFFPQGNGSLPTSPKSPSQILAGLLPPFTHGTYTLDSSNSTGVTAHASLPDGEAFQLSANIIPNVVYSPTAQDLARAQAAGFPIYNFQLTTSGSPGSEEDTMSFFIPYSALPQSVVSYFDSGVGGAAAHSGLEVFAHSYHTGFDAAETIQVVQWSFQLANSLDQTVGCSGELSDEVSSIQTSALLAIGSEGVGIVGSIAVGALGGPVGLAFGIAFFVANQAVEHFVKDPLLEQATELNTQMCGKKPNGGGGGGGGNGGGANPDWCYDPSGFVYEAVTSNRLSNVTVSIFYRPNATVAWTLWDATGYGEQNQELTDSQGVYGWNVPVGQWMVVYQKAGYETVESQVLNVPPPVTGLDIGMVSTSPPTVSGISAVAGASSSISVLFDKYVIADDLSNTTISVTGPSGSVSGTIVRVNPRESPSGTSLTLEAEFIPTSGLSAGSSYTVTVNDAIESYANVSMSSNYVASVTALSRLSYDLSDNLAVNGNITIGQSLNATASTNNVVASFVDFAWYSPDGTLMSNSEIATSSGMAASSFTLEELGTWTLIANYTDGQTVYETESLTFSVVPVALLPPAGDLNVIAGSISYITTSANSTGRFYVNSTDVNGIQITVFDDTYPAGTSTYVNSFIYSSLPSVIANFTTQTGTEALFYIDVRITNANGTATVCDTNSLINGANSMHYIPPNDTVWSQASDIQYFSPNTLCGNIPVLLLHGTPIAINSVPSTTTSTTFSTMTTSSTTTSTISSSSTSSSYSSSTSSTASSTTSSSMPSSTSSTTSSTKSGGIPVFSLELGIAVILIVLAVSSYLLIRRRR